MRSRINIYEHNKKFLTQKLMIENQQDDQQTFLNYTMNNEFKKKYHEFNKDTVILGSRFVDEEIAKYAPINGIESTYNKIRPFFDYVANINDHLKKQQSGNELINNARKINNAINYSMNNSKANASIQTLNDIHNNFKNADSFYVFDTETLSGMGSTGYNELDKLQEISFRKFKKVNGKLEEVVEDRLETLVGLNESEYKHYYDIFIKNFNERGWEGNQKYEVIANRLAKLGHDDTILDYLDNGAVVTKVFASDASEDLISKTNIERGLKEALKIGEHQSKNKLANGLTVWEDQVLRSTSIFNNNFVAGYNSTNFDFEKLNQQAATIWRGLNPAQKSYYIKELGLKDGQVPTINPKAGHYLDFRDVVRIGAENIGKAGIYNNDIQALNTIHKLKATLLQQEALGEIFAKDATSIAAHTAGADVTTLAHLLGGNSVNGGSLLDKLMIDINDNASKIQGQVDYNSVLMATQGEFFNDFTRKGALNFTYDRSSGAIRTFNGFSFDSNGDVRNLGKFGKATGIKKNVAYKIGFMGEMDMSEEWINTISSIHQDYAQGKLWSLTLNPVIDKKIAGSNNILEDPSTYLFTSKEAMEGFISNHFAHIGNIDANGNLSELSDKVARDEVKKLFSIHTIKDGQLSDAVELTIEDLVANGTKQLMNDSAARSIRENEYTKAVKFNKLQDYLIENGADTLEKQKAMLSLATAEKTTSDQALKIKDDISNILGYYDKSTKTQQIYQSTLNNTINSYEYMASRRNVTNELVRAVESYGDIGAEKKQFIYDNLLRNLRDKLAGSKTFDEDSKEKLINNSKHLKIYGKDLDYFEFDLPGFFKASDSKEMSGEIDDVLRVNLKAEKEFSLVNELLRRSNGNDNRLQSEEMRQAYGMLELKRFIKQVNSMDEYKGMFNDLLYGQGYNYTINNINIAKNERSIQLDNLYKNYNNILDNYVNDNENVISQRKYIHELINQKHELIEQYGISRKSYIEELRELSSQYKIYSDEEWLNLSIEQQDNTKALHKKIEDRQKYIINELKFDDENGEISKLDDLIQNEYEKLFNVLDTTKDSGREKFKQDIKNIKDASKKNIDDLYDELYSLPNEPIQNVDTLAEQVVLAIKDFRKNNPTSGFSKERNYQNVLGKDELFDQANLEQVKNIIEDGKKELSQFFLLNTNDEKQVNSYIEKLVDDVLMPSIDIGNGVKTSNIEDIMNHMQNVYGHNEDILKLLKTNLELQRNAHIKGMTNFFNEVSNIGGLVEYNAVDKTIGFNLGNKTYPLYGIPKTAITHDILHLQEGNQSFASTFKLDVKSAMSNNKLEGNAEIVSILEDIYKPFNYSLKNEIKSARTKHEDPVQAILRSVAKVASNARELSALGKMNTNDMYSWRKTDYSEAITALPNILPQLKAYDAWQDSDFIEIIERNKKNISNGFISSEVYEAFQKNEQDVIKILTGIGAGKENTKRNTTEFVVSKLSNNLKGKELAYGINLSGEYSPVAFSELDSSARPVLYATNGRIFDKKKIQDKINDPKNKLNDRISLGSKIVSREQSVTRRINGIGEIESGFSFINASISEQEFKKKVNKAFDEKIMNANTKSEEKRLIALKEQFSGINLTEQEKIIDGRVTDLLLAKTETQRIATHKNFIRDLTANTEQMNMRLKNAMPTIEIAKSGEIVFTLGKEDIVKRGEALFSEEFYGKKLFDTIGVKENAGIFGFRYYAKNTDLEIDENTINEFLNKNKSKIIKDGKIDQIKVGELLDSEFDSSFYINNAYIKGYNKGTLEYAEKGMYNALLSGAGTIDSNVAKALDAIGLEDAKGRILSEKFIDTLKDKFNELEHGFKSFKDFKNAINAEKFAMTDFFRTIEGFEDVVAISVDNTVKHGNVGAVTKYFINEIAHKHMSAGISEKEAYEKAFNTIKDSGILTGYNMEFDHETGRIIVDSAKDPVGTGMNIDAVKKLAKDLNLYNADSAFAIVDNEDPNKLVGYKFLGTTYFNEDFSGTSRSSFEKENIKKHLDDTRKQLRALADDDPLKHTLADKVNTLEHAYNVSKRYDKSMKISSRETNMLGLYGYDDKTMNRIKSRLGENEHNKIYGHMLDDTGRLTAKYNDANVNQFFIDDIKSYARENALAHKEEFNNSLDAIKFNANGDINSIDYMTKKGFKEVKSVNDLVLPIGTNADEIIDPNSTIDKRLLINTGLSGKDKYVAVSTGKDYQSDEVQKALGSLKNAVQTLEDGQKGINGVLDNGRTISDLKARVGVAVQGVRDAMEKSTRSTVEKMTKVELGGYSYEKASMIRYDKNNTYHMYKKSFVNGKSLAEWADQGVHYDASFHGRQYFENLGYFDEKVWKDQFGFTSVKQMEEHLVKHGTVGVELRTPTIKEGSMAFTHQFLDTSLKDGQSKATASLVLARNQDHDGDSIIQAELRHKETGMTYAEYIHKKKNTKQEINQEAENYFTSLNAAQTYRASTINNNIFENAVNNLVDDNVENAPKKPMLTEVIEGKKVNLNGNTITAFSQLETDSALRNRYLTKYGELESAVIDKLGEKKYSNLELIDRAKEFEKHISTLSKNVQDEYRDAVKFVEILGKDNASAMSKTAGTVSIGFMNTPLAVMRRAAQVSGMSRDDLQYLQAASDILEENIISRKHAVDKSISLTQTFRSNIKRMLSGDTYAADEINELIRNNFSEDIVNKVRVYSNLDVSNISDEEVMRNVTNSFSNLSAIARNTSNFEHLLLGEEIDRKLTGKNATQALSGVSKDSSGIVSVLADIGLGDYSPNKESYINLNGYAKSSKNKLTQVTGSAAEEIIQGASSSGLAKAALGLAAAVMATGYIGGNPTTPADNQAQQMNSYESLQDEDLSIQQLPQGAGQGYVININAQSNKGQEHVAQAIQKAMQSSVTTDINISMSMNDNTRVVNSRTLEKLMSNIL